MRCDHGAPSMRRREPVDPLGSVMGTSTGIDPSRLIGGGLSSYSQDRRGREMGYRPDSLEFPPAIGASFGEGGPGHRRCYVGLGTTASGAATIRAQSVAASPALSSPALAAFQSLYQSQ